MQVNYQTLKMWLIIERERTRERERERTREERERERERELPFCFGSWSLCVEAGKRLLGDGGPADTRPAGPPWSSGLVPGALTAILPLNLENSFLTGWSGGKSTAFFFFAAISCSFCRSESVSKRTWRNTM